MAGIYIHVPFCRRACHYCDFHFTTNLANRSALVEALVKEIEDRKDYLKDEVVSTIYFGGGTPSLLSGSEIQACSDAIQRHYCLNESIELTLEANPEDLSADKLKELKDIGVNRLSLGTQSFIDSELKWMNRMHSSEEAKTAIRTAQHLGFDNISIDLIFGLPEQTEKDWTKNLETAASLDVQHISSYGLTVENKTVLENRIRKGEQVPPSEEMAEQFFRMNMEFLPDHGFEHYETSNYAKEGFISQHNSNYWRGEKYLGIGPSAHSFNGHSRQWNVRSNAAYIAAIKQGKPFSEQEELSVTDKLNEHVLTGLRTKWGIQKSVCERIQPSSWQSILSNIKKAGDQYFDVEEETIHLNQSGILLTDKLTSELFI